MAGHSPTPWTKHPEVANRLLDASGNWTVCEVPGSDHSPAVIADADYILCCVNLHEDLVEAVSYLLGVLQAEGMERWKDYQKEIAFAKATLERAL